MAYNTIKPKDHFRYVSFTGNGSTNAITGVGFAPDGAGMGAGVPSLGLIFGAKGERVTRNFGPPSPGLTGAPSLGVSFKVGLGGVGNPS